MPTLEDLPPEILARLPSGHPFLLESARSHDTQWRKDRSTIAALARTSRKLHAFLNPVLYRSIILTSLPYKNRLLFIRTISACPQIANHVQDLKLDLFEQKFPLRDSTSDFVARMTPEQLNASDGDWYRLLGVLLFPSLTNLKQYAVRCTRYEAFPYEFPSLVNAHIRSYCQGKGIGVDHAAVRQLLLAPKIQNLTLSGPYITDANKLEDISSAVSKISTLALRVILLSPESLYTLLRIPKNLTSFEFYSASMRAPFQEAGRRDKFLTFNDIGAALEPHRNNLDTVRICFPSSDAELTSSIFGGLSFSGFPRLTKLSIAPEMFLGWKECIHRNTSMEEDPALSKPVNFVNCLPYCLEHLTIFVAQYQRARNGVGYVYEIVEGILKNKRTFYKLARLDLACCKGVITCEHCRRIAMTYLDRAGEVKMDEMLQIQGICEEASVQFNWINEVWEDP